MSNSPLVTYTKISPNRTSPRTHAIDTITVHCFVAQVTAEGGCNASRFIKRDLENGASCNYVVGKDGSIGLCVEESDRSWCTSNRSNDQRAITIEVASDKVHPYKVTDAAYAALLDLITDICRRNGKRRLIWMPDRTQAIIYEPAPDEMKMTVHRWFANKACPGAYLYDRHPAIAEEVTKRLTKEDADMDDDRVREIVQKELAKAFPVYGTLKDVPSWYKESIRKLLESGSLVGSDTAGPGIEDNIINVNDTFCRVMSVLARPGAIDAIQGQDYLDERYSPVETRS